MIYERCHFFQPSRPSKSAFGVQPGPLHPPRSPRTGPAAAASRSAPTVSPSRRSTLAASSHGPPGASATAAAPAATLILLTLNQIYRVGFHTSTILPLLHHLKTCFHWSFVKKVRTFEIITSYCFASHNWWSLFEQQLIVQLDFLNSLFLICWVRKSWRETGGGRKNFIHL